MLSVHELRKVVWRRRSAVQEYSGYLVVIDEGIRLLGREQATGIDAALTIPSHAVSRIRLATGPEEQIGGGGTLVLEVADGMPLLVRPSGGEQALATLTRRLTAALQPPHRHARAG